MVAKRAGLIVSLFLFAVQEGGVDEEKYAYLSLQNPGPISMLAVLNL
jgi:hypothetical protein